MGTDDAVVPSHVESVLCGEPDVEFVVAFGSRVTGDHRPSSDLDVVVSFVDGLSATERFRKRCRLSARVQQEDIPFVDLADLDELSLSFAHAAVSGDFCCGDEAAFRERRADIEAAFERERSTIERDNRETIRRIATEGLRG